MNVKTARFQDTKISEVIIEMWPNLWMNWRRSFTRWRSWWESGRLLGQTLQNSSGEDPHHWRGQASSTATSSASCSGQLFASSSAFPYTLSITFTMPYSRGFLLGILNCRFVLCSCRPLWKSMKLFDWISVRVLEYANLFV